MSPHPNRPPAALPATLAGIAQTRIEAALESAAGAGVELPPRAEWPGDVERVWACSKFVADACTFDPALLAGLLASGDLLADYAPLGDEDDGLARTTAHFAARLGDPADEAALLATLRVNRRREWVRLAWRDLGGLGTLDDLVRDASAYAEAALDLTLARLHAWQAMRLGEPRDTGGRALALAVLALGKLGAGELNFSSDIDLVFVYGEGGETHGAERSVSNHEFFVRLARRLVQSLSEQTSDGYVFRVDTRLRPFGQSGPLVASVAMIEDYYQTHGRDWERYALIRAHTVAGDRRCGTELIERLRPFVYRRYLDFGALESMRAMKALITREITRKGLEDNVKLGAGGIREIEFTGQAFQMVRGGRIPALRDRRIVRVVAELGRRGYLPPYAVDELVGAYRFLRDTEHRLQEADDRQTHLLPADDDARAALAAGMGYAGWDAFARDLDRHRQRVHAHFEQVLGPPEDEDQTMTDDLRLLLVSPPAEEQARAVLEHEGFRDPAGAWRCIEHFRQSHSVRLLAQPGRERLERLFPSVLRAVVAQDDGGPTLERVFEVIEIIARRSAYLALLGERPLALSQLVRLCAASPWIARHIGRYPILFDELLDPRSLYSPLGRAGLETDLAARLADIPAGDTEQEMAALRLFKQANVLRVAAADVSGALPLMKVSDRLTEIAEVVLEATVRLVRRDLRARHGEASSAGGEPVPFAVIGYGKLGGLELGYGSDLDLVFVHGSEDPARTTTGGKPLDHFVYFARLAQRTIHFLTTFTPDGTLYEVDSRLRPDGAKGVLVNGLESLRRYLCEQAWTWEHQALVRARVVAGDPALGHAFAALRREILLLPRDGAKLRAEVRDMRARMRTQLGSRAPDLFDIKQDPGGIADIEFMVQYGALRWASRLGEHLLFTDNIRLLEGFALAGLMPRTDAELLTDAYRAFRGRVHELALQERPGTVNADELADERAAVTRIWQGLMEG